MPRPSSAPAGVSSASKDLLRARLIRYRMLFRKYWWVVAFGTALGIGVASWFIAAQKVVYVSVARMLVSGKINLPDGGTFSEEMSHFMSTQGELMKDEARFSELYQQQASLAERLSSLKSDAPVNDRSIWGPPG